MMEKEDLPGLTMQQTAKGRGHSSLEEVPFTLGVLSLTKQMFAEIE